MGLIYISYFNGNGFSILRSLTSISGFLILMAIIIFIILMYKSIKLK
jgi:lipoprotein signal peptidase